MDPQWRGPQLLLYDRHEGLTEGYTPTHTPHADPTHTHPTDAWSDALWRLFLGVPTHNAGSVRGGSGDVPDRSHDSHFCVCVCFFPVNCQIERVRADRKQEAAVKIGYTRGALNPAGPGRDSPPDPAGGLWVRVHRLAAIRQTTNAVSVRTEPHGLSSPRATDKDSLTAGTAPEASDPSAPRMD